MNDREMLHDIYDKLQILNHQLKQHLYDPSQSDKPTIIKVFQGANLQKAIDQAVVDGQYKNVELHIQPAVYVGDFKLRSRKNAQYSIKLLPDATVTNGRIHPDDSSWTFKLQSESGYRCLSTEYSADNYHFLGLQTIPLRFPDREAIIIDGDADGGALTDPEKQPTNITFDRCLVRGHDKLGLHRGIRCNGRHVEIIQSYIDRCFEYGRDCQAVGGWNFSGPVTVEDSYLEAASENFMTGGAGIYMGEAGLPVVILRKNTFSKNLAWKTLLNDKGKQPQIKNLLEFKHVRKALVEYNIFENCWSYAQGGTAILFTPKANAVAGHEFVAVTDVDFQYNIIRDVASVFSIANLGDDPVNRPVLGSKRIRIADNIIHGVNNKIHGGDGRLILIQGGVEDLQISHNSVLDLTANAFLHFGGPNSVSRLSFNHNIVPEMSYGMHSSGGGGGLGGLKHGAPDAYMQDNAIRDDANRVPYPPGQIMIPAADWKFEHYKPLFQAKTSDDIPVGADVDKILEGI